jgi:hypothetical protein
MRKEFARFVVQNQHNASIRSAISMVKRLVDGDPSEPVARVNASLWRLAKSDKPIIVGPWLSEVGFELLYWIPFLRWVSRRYRLPPERLTVVSRGGVASWYEGIAARYVDVFDHYTPEQFRELNAKRWMANAGVQKHTAQSSFDDEILSTIGATPESHALLHPELMYLLFDDYWIGTAGARRFTSHCNFEKLTSVKHPFLQDLPASYVAVKFYERPSFPLTRESQVFVSDFTRRLAERSHVVFMSTGLKADDHMDFEAPDHPNITTVHDSIIPSDNLAMQSSIVAHATSVYSTYGGFSYLPLYYGVPSTGIYSTDKHFVKLHGCAAYQLSYKLGAPLSIVHFEALKC